MAKSKPRPRLVFVQAVFAVASESGPALHYILQSHPADRYAAVGVDFRQQGKALWSHI